MERADEEKYVESSVGFGAGIGLGMFIAKPSLAPCNKHEPVLSFEYSPLAAAIMAADDVFETTYVPQPNFLPHVKQLS